MLLEAKIASMARRALSGGNVDARVGQESLEKPAWTKLWTAKRASGPETTIRCRETRSPCRRCVDVESDYCQWDP